LTKWDRKGKAREGHINKNIWLIGLKLLRKKTLKSKH
jgi:hypothetical protein